MVLNMASYGYVRVSSQEQNEARQMIAMHESGVADKHIFMDKLSGKDFERPRYKALIKRLREGDVLYIKSIDRLGRNYSEILEQWRIITKEKRADVIVIDMPLLNTHVNRDLTGTLIADIVLQLLSYCAQNERENIRQRQAEGIRAARAKGVRFGRPNAQFPENFGALVKQWEKGLLPFDDMLAQCGVCRSTFYKWVKKRREGSFFPGTP
jgi:DNA invertase Pin-like site-specific DNA recombinase